MMKLSPLIAAMFFAGSVSAEVVTATGYGSSFDRALTDAKQEALEMGASTFVTGEKRVFDGSIEDRIYQYNGGIIKKYDIIRSEKTEGEYSVTIEADVVAQDNRKLDNTAEQLNADIEEFDRRHTMVQVLDDPGKAIRMEMSDYSTVVGSYETYVRVRVRLSWQPKWLSDVNSFSTVIGEKGLTESNTHAEIAGNVTNALLNIHPLLGVVGWEAMKPPPTKKNPHSSMVCFATDRKDNNVDCRNIGVDFQRFNNEPMLELMANGQTIHKQYIDPWLFEKVYPGQYKQNRFLRGHKVTFNQPALVIYTDEVYDAYLEFKVPTKLLRGANDIKVYLR